MILGSAGQSSRTFSSPWKSPPRVIPTFQSSPNDSAKKSGNSTHVSERSKSSKRVLVPRCPQLDRFFGSSRHRSAQKLPLSSRNLPSAEAADAFAAPKAQQKKERIAFLRQNLNHDYYDDSAEAAKGPAATTAVREEQPSSAPLIRQREKSNKRTAEYGSPLPHRPTERAAQKGSSKVIGVRKEGSESTCRRARSPKTIAVQRIMSPRRQALTKATSLHSLEYTFGIS